MSGARTPEMSQVREVLTDDRTWTAIGVVVSRGGDAHYEIVHDDGGNPVDVLVDVDLMPRGEYVTARLAASAGGPGAGLWRIPPVGTEVVVVVPGGELEGGPVVIGVLSSRNVPNALDKDTLVLAHPGKVILYSSQDKVYLGSSDGTGTKPVALKDHLVNLGTWTHVPASGTGVTPCKLLWNPPGAGGSPTEVTTATELDGKIKEGSATTEAKP